MNRSMKPYLIIYDICCIGSLVALPALLFFASFRDQLLYAVLIGVGIGDWLTRSLALRRYQQNFGYYRVAWRLRRVVLVLLTVMVVLAILLAAVARIQGS
ncbi:MULTISPECIES: hypothetical protein [Levilactobacillus]|uniref:hypothetical protein n=2 Tax=Lactobacillaceae TaxID=33958 RepID=UPI00195086A2|nr:hypothetical protein [Levilactobacillus sp. 244-2]